MSGQRAGEVDSSVPQIAAEELRIALRLQTLVRQIIRATLEQERELEQLWKLNKPSCRVFASSAAFGAAFEFFAQLCELWKAWCRASECCGSARLGHFARNCPSLAFQK